MSKKPWQESQKEHMSRLMKELWEDPEYRQRCTEAIRAGCSTPENRERARQLMLRMWQLPEYREKLKNRKPGSGRVSPEFKEYLKQLVQEMWDDDDWRHNRWEKMRQKNLDSKAPKLSDDEVREVRLLLAQGHPVGEVAERFRVSQPIISYIKAGKTYRHVK